MTAYLSALTASYLTVITWLAASFCYGSRVDGVTLAISTYADSTERVEPDSNFPSLSPVGHDTIQF